MSAKCLCFSCSSPLEPAQELRFLVETANLDEPGYLEHIRQLPARNGKPIPVCKSCQRRIASSPRVPQRPRSVISFDVLAAVGFLSMGWVLRSLLAGPRS